MTVKDAAKVLECSPSLVYSLVKEKRLKAIRLGRRGKRGKIIIEDAAVRAFKEECAVLADD